jgi:hypothetical protein
MNVSDKRINANRLNAARSTGPRSDEGKRKSSMNAIKHGLCASVHTPEDADQIQGRAVDLYYSFKPFTGYQCWALNVAAVCSLRIDRVEAIERRVREKIRLRAELTWDDDRALEAEVLGGMISKRPAETLTLLRKTFHGCEWLIKRWAMLAHAADNAGGSWTDAQVAMAFDLMGTPAEFRAGKPGASLDLHGRVIETADDYAAFARRMVDELIGRMEEVSPLDEVDRALAAADFDHDKSGELKRLRRYETMLHTRLRWSVKQMQFQGPLGAPDPACYPAWKVEPEPPAEKPEPRHPDEIAAEKHDPTSPHPPFCLTPDEFPEPGQKADIPAILESRKEKRRVKADNRREAKRRQVKALYKA